MAFSLPFTCSRVSLLALCAVVSACGDDEGQAPLVISDAGGETQSTVAPETSASPEVSTEPTPVADAGPSRCAAVASACAGKDDVDGVGALCLDISDSNDEEECGVVTDTCLTFCETGEVPASDAGAPSRDECHEMGELCHAYDESTGLGHLCHEVGHGGNVTWCSVIYSACAQLCHIEASDAGDGHAHEGDAAHDEGDASHHETHDGGHHEHDSAPGDATHGDATHGDAGSHPHDAASASVAATDGGG